jgi:hypothetical protein
MSLIAKPIVKNQLWVVTDGNSKVGNVEFIGDGYSLKLGNSKTHFDSTKSIQRLISIEFQRPYRPAKQNLPYAVWPTSSRTYNNMFDVKRKLHVYTKTKKSKCYHTAGWFNLKLNGEWQSTFCPKYIFIQRYPYSGPFMTKEEAELNK